MSIDVLAGQGIPEVIRASFVPGGDYSICLDFLTVKEIKRWSPERKAAARRRNLERRVIKNAPLFAEEIMSREIAERPDYFKGK